MLIGCRFTNYFGINQDNANLIRKSSQYIERIQVNLLTKTMRTWNLTTENHVLPPATILGVRTIRMVFFHNNRDYEQPQAKKMWSQKEYQYHFKESQLAPISSSQAVPFPPQSN